MTDKQAIAWIKKELPECGSVIVTKTLHQIEDDSMHEWYTASIFKYGSTNIAGRGEEATVTQAAMLAVAEYIRGDK